MWAFLSEPYHLSDWWPGISGVDPDVRGFAPAARWKVHATRRHVLLGSRGVESTLLVRDVHPFERWSFHVVDPAFDADIRIRSVGPDRTLVTVATNGPKPEVAVRRLYDLIQTAATM